MPRPSHLCWLLAAAFGCGGEAPVPEFTETASAASADTATTSRTTPACLATGQWELCAILERLDRSGLAPIVDSAAAATEPPLTATGFVVRVGRGELEVYLYPDAAAAQRDLARLDRATYVEYTAPLTMENQPTLIVSGNAVVVLHSRNDHQRERVGDAITAGAPARAP